MDLESLLLSYDYPLKSENIAAVPAIPRDSSKLLVYDRKTGKTAVDTFLHLPRHLPKGALLVFNDTKVVPARLIGHIKTGGKVEFLCTKFSGGEVMALSERGLDVGEKVWLSKRVAVTVIEKIGKEYRLEIPRGLDIKRYMRKRGITPLPPYLKHSPLSESDRRKKYQSVFAKEDGSIAAPTASLHFTQRLLSSLKKAKIKTAYVTLHVNLGTFMPLTQENIASGLLHEETFEIPEATRRAIATAKADGHPVIPVGTTALRALESMDQGGSSTRLFIREGYSFKVADGLITNFHVPKSSLLMLVAALIGRERLLQLYTFAQKHGFRFLSFGDGMLIR